MIELLYRLTKYLSFKKFRDFKLWAKYIFIANDLFLYSVVNVNNEYTIFEKILLTP